MPLQRGTEMPQRQSSARVPLQLRTSSSDSDSSQQHRLIPDRSPKLVGGVDRRVSPRSVQSGTVINPRKLGTRVADLETQLGQAQNELKNLKGQLAFAEAAKIEAQEQLKMKKTTLKKKKKPLSEANPEKTTCQPPLEVVDDLKEIDEAEAIEVMADRETEVNEEPVKQDIEELILLRNQLEQKEKDMEEVRKENELLKKEIDEANTTISTFRAKEEEISAKMDQMEEEMNRSSQDCIQLKEKLETVEKAKDDLELEMKKMKVQTEQWRKAADAAAAVLAGDMEMKCRVSGRCSSMDKQFVNGLEISGGGFEGLMVDDGYEEGGRRKMKMFGDLWKRKGQK